MNTMSQKLQSFTLSSIAKKKIMGLTGLGLCGFVKMHMLGNLLVFKGAEAYNVYGHRLTHLPMFIVAEIATIAMFALHIYMGLSLTAENRAARASRYAVEPNGEKEASLASRSMIYTGSIVGIFFVHHLISFRFGPYYSVTYNGEEMRDLYRLMHDLFSNPLYVIWYVLAVVLLGYHLTHGFWSSFQSLGVMQTRWKKCAQIAGYVFSIMIAVGFASQPIYVYLMSGKQ